MSPIAEHLRALYPDADPAALQQRIAESFERHAGAPHRPDQEWSERDALLITYADTLTEPGVAPLRTLADFLENRLQDAFSAVHLLPYFPFTSDDGFAISSYREVRHDLGDWDDVSRIAGKFDLMTDLVLNHCSRNTRWHDACGPATPVQSLGFMWWTRNWTLPGLSGRGRRRSSRRCRTMRRAEGFGPRSARTSWISTTVIRRFCSRSST